MPSGRQPAPKSWLLRLRSKLYEFFARDGDGNYFRVFYDFGSEEKSENQG